MKELLADEFERIFGFKPRAPLTREMRERAQEIDSLFATMREELGLSEIAILRRAGIRGPLCGYLNALHTCPDSVWELCKACVLEHERAKRLRAA